MKNDVVKKTVYNKLVSNVNNINTSEFVSKTKYNIDKSDLEKQQVMQKKALNASGLTKKQI